MDLIERNVIKKKKKIFPSSSPNYELFDFNIWYTLIISLHIFNLQILFLISFYHTALSWKQIEESIEEMSRRNIVFSRTSIDTSLHEK